MSMKFSVSFASRGAQRRHAEIIPTILSQNSTASTACSSSTGAGFLLQPAQWISNQQQQQQLFPFRGDLDKDEQLQYIQLEREKRHGRWLTEQAIQSSPPVLDHMAYCCEALKMLITAARYRQLNKRPNSPQPQDSEEKKEVEVVEAQKNTIEGPNDVTITATGPVTSPTSTALFDLKNIQNYRNLMEDVSIIVTAARQRTPEAGQKMIANVVEQLAVLQLWA